jgi:hypothetical protein
MSVDETNRLENVRWENGLDYEGRELRRDSVVEAFCTIRIQRDVGQFYLLMLLHYLCCVIALFYAQMPTSTASSTYSSGHGLYGGGGVGEERGFRLG